ncbi:hypothetical protein [Halopiger thermotolerans]
MSYVIKCKRCPFDTYAHKQEHAKAIAAVHVQDCISDTSREDIYISGGLHKFGHLGWVNLEYLADWLRYEHGQINEGVKTYEEAFDELREQFLHPDEELESTEEYVNDGLMLDLLEVAKKHG